MSHEGIRFVSAEEVLRDSAQAAAHQGESLPADAVTPGESIRDTPWHPMNTGHAISASPTSMTIPMA